MKTKSMLIVGGIVIAAAFAAGTGPSAIAAGTAETTEADTLPNLLIIVGSEGVTSYDFAVDGELQKSDERGATIDSEDTVDGSRATGAVGGHGADAYRFSGDITTFSLDGDATVYLNDEEVDPAELGQSTTTTPTTTTTETDEFYGSVEPADEYDAGPRNYVRVEACDRVVVHGGDAYDAEAVGIYVGGEYDWIDLERYEPIRYTAPDGQTINRVELWPHSSDEHEAGMEPMVMLSPCSG